MSTSPPTLATGPVAPSATPAPAPPASPPAVSVVFGINLLTLVATGVAVSWWLYQFTGWFDAFGTLLALGGIFSWLAFVTKVIPDDRLKGLQKLVADQVLDNPLSWKVILGALALLTLVSSFFGTLQVENAPGHAETKVRAYRAADPGPDSDERLAENARLRSLWFTGWGPAGVRVKVAGLPVAETRVRPWWQAPANEKISVPGMLVRPVILLFGEPILMRKEANKDLHLKVTIGDNTLTAGAYDGRPLWVGCPDDDIPVPQTAQQHPDWVAALKIPEAAVKLERPEVLPDMPPLVPEQVFKAQLEDNNGKPHYEGRAVIQKTFKGQVFVQVVVLRKLKEP